MIRIIASMMDFKGIMVDQLVYPDAVGPGSHMDVERYVEAPLAGRKYISGVYYVNFGNVFHVCLYTEDFEEFAWLTRSCIIRCIAGVYDIVWPDGTIYTFAQPQRQIVHSLSKLYDPARPMLPPHSLDRARIEEWVLRRALFLYIAARMERRGNGSACLCGRSLALQNVGIWLRGADTIRNLLITYARQVSPLCTWKLGGCVMSTTVLIKEVYAL